MTNKNYTYQNKKVICVPFKLDSHTAYSNSTGCRLKRRAMQLCSSTTLIQFGFRVSRLFASEKISSLSILTEVKTQLS